MSKRTAVLGATGMATVLAVGIAGCGLLPGSPPTRSAPTQVAATSTTPSASATPTPTASTTSASATPSAVAPVKATGQLTFYKNNLVSKALVGTCTVVAGTPTVTLADDRNDFYTTVDLTIVLADDGGEVTSIAGDFGEDSELITWKLVHPVKGTSAHVVASGGEYRISGKASLIEGDAKTGTLVPYSITVKCAKSNWLG